MINHLERVINFVFDLNGLFIFLVCQLTMNWSLYSVIEFGLYKHLSGINGQI